MVRYAVASIWECRGHLHIKGLTRAAFNQRCGDEGLTLREAGACAGVMDYTAVAMAVRRLKEWARREADDERTGGCM